MDVLCQSWTKVVMLRGARSVFLTFLAIFVENDEV